jgi:hypothetical protein
VLAQLAKTVLAQAVEVGLEQWVVKEAREHLVGGGGYGVIPSQPPAQAFV